MSLFARRTMMFARGGTALVGLLGLMLYARVPTGKRQITTAASV